MTPASQRGVVMNNKDVIRSMEEGALMRKLGHTVSSVLVVVFAAAALLTTSTWSRAQSGAPTLISYQGLVAVGGLPYSGTGSFKFAIVDQAGTTTFWSNDGTSSGGSEPTSAVDLTVALGLFNVLLGDTSLTNMGALGASAFDGTERYLRVWFSSGGAFDQLTPDRRIAAAPYALQVEEAKNAATAGDSDTVDGQHASEFAAAGASWSLTGNGGTVPGIHYVGTSDAQPLVFRTSGTERMRLDTSGRLGLGAVPGTSAPLTIRGAGAGSEWMQLMDSAGANQWHLNYLDGGVNFAESGVSDFRLYLEDGGDVGIGVGAPTARLHVRNSSGQQTGRFENLTTGASTNAVVGTTTSTTGGTRTGYFHAQGESGNTDALYALNSSGTNNNAVGYFGYTDAGTHEDPPGSGTQVPDRAYTGMLTGLWADLPAGNSNGASAAGFFRNRSVSGAGYAGFFVGNVLVQGTLSKSAGSFIIDHPLDPANRTLSHAFVESPDMMNVYNGNVMLDASGEAWVELPEWFEALNSDYRYQLTCIGAFAPVYVASEIEGNRFKIGGGTSGLKVSWQVTGIRRDAYAERYRIPVEKDKDRPGTYLCPECFGVSKVTSGAGRPGDRDGNPTR